MRDRKNEKYRKENNVLLAIATMALAIAGIMLGSFPDADMSGIFKTLVSEILSAEAEPVDEEQMYYYPLSPTSDMPLAVYEEKMSGYADFRTLSEADLEKMDSIISSIINPDMNRVERIKAVHDWMVINIRYDLNYKQHTASDTLNNGLAVCSGYSALFAIFMDRLNIPNEEVSGTAYDGASSGGHAWNIVALEDGKYYVVDVTWDDPIINGTSDYKNGKNLSYEYFLVSAGSILYDHVPDYEIDVPLSNVSCNWRSYIGRGGGDSSAVSPEPSPVPEPVQEETPDPSPIPVPVPVPVQEEIPDPVPVQEETSNPTPDPAPAQEETSEQTPAHEPSQEEISDSDPDPVQEEVTDPAPDQTSDDEPVSNTDTEYINNPMSDPCHNSNASVGGGWESDDEQPFIYNESSDDSSMNGEFEMPDIF